MADREALDLLLGDMAGHQTLTGRETTPTRNQALAAEVFERLDRKAQEPKPAAPVVADAPDPNEPKLSDIEAKKRGFRILRGDKVPEGAPLVLDGKTLERYEKVSERVQLLLSKPERGPLGQPSWRERVLAVQSLQFTGRSVREIDAVRKAFGMKIASVHARSGGRASAALAISMIVELSNEVFGPWWAEQPKPVVVG